MPTRLSLIACIKSEVKYLPVIHSLLTDKLYQIEKVAKIYKLLIKKVMNKHIRDLVE